mmetsp:Transcript_27757/g.66978  ORF Transcript_27757/g.66978 Transcript_27757/m.66978 type:complete len:144 (-) Transcript_27757:101-532(-)
MENNHLHSIVIAAPYPVLLLSITSQIKYHIHHSTTMKSVQQILLLLVAAVACVSGFAPATRPVAKSALSMSKAPMNNEFVVKDEKKAAAVAAFATAMAPFAAHATEVDEATVIGYGAGLVACVVSLAVGFSIGYGTLEKPGKN